MEDQSLIKAASDIENDSPADAKKFADKMLEAIITEGLNEEVDATINFF